MTANAWFQIALYLGILTILAPPLGLFIARVFEGRAGRMEKILARSSGSCTVSMASAPARR